MAQHPGVSYTGSLFCNNFWPRGTADDRVNKAIGGSYLKLTPQQIDSYRVDTAGTQRLMLRLGAAEHVMYADNVKYFTSDASTYCGRIGSELGSKFTISGPLSGWFTAGLVDNSQMIQLRADQRCMFIGMHPVAEPDTGIHLGLPDKRFNTVYASNGTIQTSDIRLKKAHGKITKARELVRSLETGIFSFDDQTLGTGEVIPAFNFPGFSAQDVDARLDKKLGTRIVDKSNPNAWGMNYSYLIPIMWEALKELLDDYDSNANINR